MSDGMSNPARYFGWPVRRARRAAGWTLTEFSSHALITFTNPGPVTSLIEQAAASTTG